VKKIYLIRHGETAWTLSGQHTGATDIPLTENGKKQAHLLAHRLQGLKFQSVLVSPMQRARQTCALAGFAEEAIEDPMLVEWNYGKYEGITSDAIHQTDPKWNIFLQGAPGGESVADIQHRTDKLLQTCVKTKGNIVIFSHGHFLRALAVRFIELSIADGKHLSLFPGSVSILAFENTIPAIYLWNDISHLI
jgi:broad specificity phosphatase PhoE